MGLGVQGQENLFGVVVVGSLRGGVGGDGVAVDCDFCGGEAGGEGG